MNIFCCCIYCIQNACCCINTYIQIYLWTPPICLFLWQCLCFCYCVMFLLNIFVVFVVGKTCGTFPFRIYATFLPLHFAFMWAITPLFLLSGKYTCSFSWMCVYVCVFWWDYEWLWLLIHTTCSSLFAMVGGCASPTTPASLASLKLQYSRDSPHSAGCETVEAKSVQNNNNIKTTVGK